MATIASRDLRNHTRDVLRQVADGTPVTVTVHGKPVAEITRPRGDRPVYLERGEVLRLLDQQRADASLADDLAWIGGDTTDDLGPIR